MNNKVLEDILEAIKDNDLTRHELEQKDYHSQLCTICWLWDCKEKYYYKELYES